MPDKWTLTFTGGNRLPGSRAFDDETAFISAVRDKLNDLHTSNVSAVLPDGTRLDEAALKVGYLNTSKGVSRAKPQPKGVDQLAAGIKSDIEEAMESLSKADGAKLLGRLRMLIDDLERPAA